MMFGQYFNNHRLVKRLAKALVRLCVCACCTEPFCWWYIPLLVISFLRSIMLFNQQQNPNYANFESLTRPLKKKLFGYSSMHVNHKGAYQPVHPPLLISAYAICFLNIIKNNLNLLYALLE